MIQAVDQIVSETWESRVSTLSLTFCTYFSRPAPATPYPSLSLSLSISKLSLSWRPRVTISSHLITPTINARNVNGHVNHVAAKLVGRHVHGVEVGGDVNPRDHIEQEGFLHHAVLVLNDKFTKSQGGGERIGRGSHVVHGKKGGLCARYRRVKGLGATSNGPVEVGS